MRTSRLCEDSHRDRGGTRPAYSSHSRVLSASLVRSGPSPGRRRCSRERSGRRTRRPLRAPHRADRRAPAARHEAAGFCSWPAGLRCAIERRERLRISSCHSNVARWQRASTLWGSCSRILPTSRAAASNRPSKPRARPSKPRAGHINGFSARIAVYSSGRRRIRRSTGEDSQPDRRLGTARLQFARPLNSIDARSFRPVSM